MFYLCFVWFLGVTTAEPTPLSASNMDFSNWNQVLSDLVHPGSRQGIRLNIFNYSGLENNQYFTKFTSQVENANVTFSNQTEFTVFWLNVYNYLAVRVVFENPCATDLFGACKPLRSIRQIGEQQPSFFLDTVWGIPYLHIKALKANMSLDDIEHEYLRTPYMHNPAWKEDPRIHACIVSASVSCGNLRNRAYHVATLDKDMDDNVQDFLKDTQRGAALEGSTLRLSLLFNWFEDDFSNTTGPKRGNTSSVDLNWFLLRHAPEDVKKAIEKNPNMTINYFSYNWDLNGSVDALCSANRVCFPVWGLIASIIGAIILTVTAVLCVRMTKPKSGYNLVN